MQMILVEGTLGNISAVELTEKICEHLRPVGYETTHLKPVEGRDPPGSAHTGSSLWINQFEDMDGHESGQEDMLESEA